MGCCYGLMRHGSHLSFRNASRYSTKRRGCNEPLKKDKPKWKSDNQMTEGQLRKIWDTLKAAAVAVECNDHELAQAIVDRASITLPHGSLMECYDELGNRYQLPAYCLAPPVNLISESKDHACVSTKVHLSTGKDLRLSASMADSIRQLKKLQLQEDIDAACQRWFFSGKQLTDKMRLQDTKIRKDFVIQVVISQPIILK
ncbi:putative ubiquitin domain-containing protein 1 [Triplophysa rosa]|uniref:Ubiquitin domain-containing protein 1 n=1 Tax=Triplophysa rosa TaxID=992332 RepID=A0A9W7WPD2_TRIRA|nr:putative ubiquitin domain-containing protein 1 [Triplophysa rosa]